MNIFPSEYVDEVYDAILKQLEVFSNKFNLISAERGADQVSVNRQFRRQEQRQKMREWVRDGTAEKVRKLSVNGITVKDMEDAHKKGYEEGYLYASTAFMKKMYAAIAKELIEAGNEKEEIYMFIHNVDQRFVVMFDADEEIDDVFNKIGIRMNLQQDGISTIEVI